jgi:hypothetical protein
MIDPATIEVRTITLNGRTGSIQRWKNGLTDDFDLVFCLHAKLFY